MKKALLAQVILDQQEKKSINQSFITREVQPQLDGLLKNSQVLILSGLRRSGKSTLLAQLRQQQSQQDYALNFDDDRLINFTIEDFQQLYEVFIEHYGEQEWFYFDEIQNVQGWERFIRRLQDQQKKVLITGSNASMLSSELGTHLTGRYIEQRIFPFSFAEYLAFNQVEKSQMKSLSTKQKSLLLAQFRKFVRQGGLPEYLTNLQDEYCHSLYQSILNRDILVRHKIVHAQAFKEMVYFLASNIGKECSFNAMRKMLGLSSPSTVSGYCTYLQDSYLCFFINRFDYSLKKQLNVAKKTYFIDQALAVKVGFRFSEDYGRLLENIVFLQLKRQNHEVYFHKSAKHECDFVIRQGVDIVEAIQVCKNLENPQTKQREINGLIDALVSYDLQRGYILVEDGFEDLEKKHDGKQYQLLVRPLWWWLLDGEKN